MTALRTLLIGILIWVAYVAARTGLQHLIPFADWAGFVRQDLAISVLRLACGLSCFWLMRLRWTDGALGLGDWNAGGWVAGLGMLMLMASQVMGAAMAQVPDWVSATWIRVVEVLIALVVAFNEEIGFRGLIQSSLRELAGRRTAVWVSSLLFTLMHMGYQPGFHLYKVFFIGFGLATLRDKGVSIKLLIVLHMLLDTPEAVVLSGGIANWGLYNLSMIVAALAALIISESQERQMAAAGERLLFAYGSLLLGKGEALRSRLERRVDGMGVTTITGTLYLVEGYPGLISGKGERIQGMLYRLRDHKLLQELDDYEGELYTRDLVSCEDGREAWAYVLKRAPKKSASLAGHTALCYT